jgi:release factor glutamine methyltransferase
MLLCCVKTINDVFIAFKEGLNTLYDRQETEALTLLIISEVCHISKASIKAFPEKQIEDAEKFTGILQQLQTGKPIQYILGYTDFFGLSFKVNPSVLIPRPETEELVQWCLENIPTSATEQSAQVLDIGTGSGCIAVSIKKNAPAAVVSAIDISTEALTVAKENAATNHTDINFIQADALNLSTYPALNNPYTLIVSNPPYVTPADKMLMHDNVTEFEPHTALFVPQDDPLLFYREIAQFAKNKLIDKGLLFFEINENYGQETVDLLTTVGFKEIELRKDLSGKYRMIKSTWHVNT